MIKIDVNYEKWIGETSQVSNGKLSEWAHYIKRIREVMVPLVKDETDRNVWEIFLTRLEKEIADYMTRPRPEPKMIEFGKGEN